MALNPVCLISTITLFRIEHFTHTGVGTDDFQSKIGNQNVILVDTPGFDDTNVCHTEILTRKKDWMKDTCDKGLLLSG